MVTKLSNQKYNGTRGKADLMKRINDKLLRVQPGEVDAELAWAAYGLTQLTCGKHSVPNPKPSNCKENPWCLGRLGLEKFEKLIKKSEEVRNEKMIESVRRDSLKQPCGLVNWANFCYVNSFLQIWFNDPVFRQIIYDWRPSDGYVTPAPPAMNVQQVINALQHLFFTLDTTPYEDANGEEFCTALRLNQEQQDAQEFTVMFFDSIDRNLMKHPNGVSMRMRIAERFNGTQTSSLRCKCGHHSDNTTKFSALNLSIDGHTTLSAAIAGYFADERLSDFACSGCGKRGGVVRETCIDHLPPVLLLSLNRYVYDSTTGRRKKLKTPLQYPRALHVDGLPHKERLSGADSSYELSAVMVHEGDNADCGHYWDIIRHPYSGVWFKYNDKIVKETKPPGVETEKADATLAKANIDLKYCYGLVYRRSEPAKQPRPPPEEISGKWAKEMDHKFYRMTDTEAQASELTLEEVSQRFRVVGEHMTALEVKPDRANQKRARDLAFLPTKLLADILTTEYQRAVELKEKLEGIADELDRTTCEKEDEAAAASQNSSSEQLNSPQKRKKNVRRRVKSMYDKRLEQVEIAMTLSPSRITLCPHERISYESVLGGEVKAVARAGAERLLADYGLAVNVVTEEGVARSDRLRTGLEVCTECVRDKTRAVHFASGLEDDVALATKIAKEVNTRCSIKAFWKTRPPPSTYYVAKSALASFKRDAAREKHRSDQLRASSRLTWKIEPVDAARAAVGGEKRRRKRAGAADREAAGAEGGGEEEEQPVTKCARSESDERGRENGGGRKKMENGEGGEEREKGPVTEEVEVLIRDMIDELAGPSSSQKASATRATDSASSLLLLLPLMNGHTVDAAHHKTWSFALEQQEQLEEEEPREAAGRDSGRGRRRVKKEEVEKENGEDEDEQMEEEDVKEVKRAETGNGRRKAKEEVKEEPEDEEDDQDEQMKEEDAADDDDEEEEEDVKIIKEVKRGGKREGKEGSSRSDDSEQSSSPTANGGENGREEGAEMNGRNGGGGSSNEEEDGPICFNDALRCDHDGINVTEFRHMVTREEWERLSGYFESKFEVSTEKPVCPDCKEDDANATEEKQASSVLIKSLNDAVGDILKAAEKRMAVGGVGVGAEVDNFTRGVCSRFVENAKKSLHPRSKGRALPLLCQSCLLCDHGQPRYEMRPMGDATNLFIVPLTLDEWRRLKTAWANVDAAQGSSPGQETNEFGAVDIELCPISGAVSSQCVQCNERLREEIEAAKYVYDSATIYVKLQSDEQPASKGSDGSGEKEKEGKGSKEGSKERSEETPDIIPLEIMTAPSSNGGGGGRQAGAVTVGGRSSTRRGASKGLIKVRMNSHQTIRDLKIALLKHVNYSPVDQLLYSTVGGEPLEDELSLMEAKVLPENYDTPIILIVQSGADAMLCSPTNEKNRAVERGFYDTALAH
ncbi:hypothetical protein PENTCL1PPCAC_24564 [Pristionchus entomophagus]|uniref:ubiquitinyl hydrolase 1 n=1 Tax=Pristionchus entomophagus TaxID=358040 RepID=A0AAV5U6D3_9BILA|nr:hypothetical protein PENTCL1PPCAC_24564 [Pristionchus entomophagus]